MGIVNYIKRTINFKFRFINRSFAGTAFKLLDVGAGNHSATRITSVFPGCEYYGLDITTSYSNSDSDFNAMKGFFEVDLTKLDYSVVPDSYFDGIVMAHVIEHLFNGDEVVPGLIKKMKPGGYFYIEYPGIKSTTLPSMHGTLNFKDDPTHVRVYSIAELKKIFTENGCEVLECGTRRNWFYIIFMPLRIIISIFKTGRLQGNLFWDLLGFAEFLYVRKK
jgi:SAM-dependent methyltransferase